VSILAALEELVAALRMAALLRQQHSVGCSDDEDCIDADEATTSCAFLEALGYQPAAAYRNYLDNFFHRCASFRVGMLSRTIYGPSKYKVLYIAQRWGC
jgi:hypothetical protein